MTEQIKAINISLDTLASDIDKLSMAMQKKDIPAMLFCKVAYDQSLKNFLADFRKCASCIMSDHATIKKIKDIDIKMSQLKIFLASL